MIRTLIAAAAIAIVATSAACAGDAGEEVIYLGPPQDNDVFAGTSEWQAPAASDTARHGNPAALAAEMAVLDAVRDTAMLAAR